MNIANVMQKRKGACNVTYRPNLTVNMKGLKAYYVKEGTMLKTELKTIGYI